MFSSEFLLLAGAHLLALASPGPDFLLLLRGGLRHGRAYGLGASLGIAVANGIYIVLALAGFSLLQQSPLLLMGMQWLASLYLAWLGWMFMRASLAPAALPGVQAHPGPRAGAGAGMVAGFLSAVLNPKNGVFYFGLFTLMVDAHTGSGRKLFYGIWMFGAVLAWDAALVCSISQRRVVAALGRALPLIERTAGLLLMIAAAALAVVRAA
ncbi:LysE family translocator [Herbaspirillum sp. NPDC087042]|uniref:LysE family translocator n=1 Tax=Herbaspirillum sp. NPDC087042 TaxID=3364004 RepID=UPI00380B241F